MGIITKLPSVPLFFVDSDNRQDFKPFLKVKYYALTPQRAEIFTLKLLENIFQNNTTKNILKTRAIKIFFFNYPQMLY